VLPKDTAQIIAITGARSGWQCLDAGGGSGFLSLFIANIVAPGKMTVYEKKKEFAKNIEHNARFSGLKNVIIKNKDVSAFSEKNLDLITLDMQGSEKIIKKCHKALKSGGWICIYSPHIEQQKRVMKEMERIFTHIRTIECVVRDWKIDTRGFTHPKYSEISHTGFMTFGRKI
jgi:tRNA (adenine57-N1/adenine58-N1)-methyltransferase